MRFFTPRTNNKILESLALYSDEVQDLMEKIIGQSAWITYLPGNANSVGVQIIPLGMGRYFAVVDCESLCGIVDKQQFIKTAVEFALKAQKISLSYRDLGVGGMAGDEGRKAFLYRLAGKIPSPDHAYTVFKVPGEEQAYVEDPRTGIFDRREKLQSRTNDQVCCFAAASMFYFCYKTITESNNTRSTPELFAELYKSNKLRALIQKLENKVGNSVATKAQVINSFVRQLTTFDNPLTLVESNTLPITTKLSYADVVRGRTLSM